MTVDDIDARLRVAMATLSVRDAVDAVAAATGAPRGQVYDRALAIRSQQDAP